MSSRSWLLSLVLMLTAFSLAPLQSQAKEPSKASKAVRKPPHRIITPAEVPVALQKILARAQIPPEAVSFLVMDANGQRPPRLSHRADEPMNPASVMKLVTTYAALDTLGPDFTWKTRIILDGEVKAGLLSGNIVLRGGGDPKLVVERLQSLLMQVQNSGVRAIHGDIVLDRSAFSLNGQNAADFDGEPLRPYNAQPDALLVNFKSLVMTFTPDPASGRALVRSEPPLAGVQVDQSVPLMDSPRCADWRSDLRASLDRPDRVQFAGSYSAGCGERVWPSAYVEPDSHSARAIEGTWKLLGGLLTGRVRDATPAELATLRQHGTLSGQTAPVRLDVPSLPLIDVVRDVNKFSNNVMAQHVFLTLAKPGGPAADSVTTFDDSRSAVQAWWRKTLPQAAVPVLDNGSGLSRSERISANGLAAMLKHASASSVGPAYADSLVQLGTDPGMRDRARAAAGRAQLKTGTLRDVTAVAGYAQGMSGRRYIVVGMINHVNASAGRAALDQLLEWTVLESP